MVVVVVVVLLATVGLWHMQHHRPARCQQPAQHRPHQIPNLVTLLYLSMTADILLVQFFNLCDMWFLFSYR